MRRLLCMVLRIKLCGHPGGLSEMMLAVCVWTFECKSLLWEDELKQILKVWVSSISIAWDFIQICMSLDLHPRPPGSETQDWGSAGSFCKPCRWLICSEVWELLCLKNQTSVLVRPEARPQLAIVPELGVCTPQASCIAGDNVGCERMVTSQVLGESLGWPPSVASCRKELKSEP